jgi:tRNA A37 methylthiotransferase MiaB
VQLNELQNSISLRRNQAYLGGTVLVLLDRPSRKSASDLLGRDDGNHGVVVPRDGLEPGDLLPVEIVGAFPHTLLGRPSGSRPARGRMAAASSAPGEVPVR